MDNTSDNSSHKVTHVYDDIDRLSALKIRNTENSEKGSKKNKSQLSPTEQKVVFEMDGIQPPAYRPLSKPLYDNPVCRKISTGNDYQIDDGVENAKEDKNNQLQKAEKYEKLFHFGP